MKSVRVTYIFSDKGEILKSSGGFSILFSRRARKTAGTVKCVLLLMLMPQEICLCRQTMGGQFSIGFFVARAPL